MLGRFVRLYHVRSDCSIVVLDVMDGAIFCSVRRVFGYRAEIRPSASWYIARNLRFFTPDDGEFYFRTSGGFF